MPVVETQQMQTRMRQSWKIWAHTTSGRGRGEKWSASATTMDSTTTFQLFFNGGKASQPKAQRCSNNCLAQLQREKTQTSSPNVNDGRDATTTETRFHRVNLQPSNFTHTYKLCPRDTHKENHGLAHPFRFAFQTRHALLKPERAETRCACMDARVTHTTNKIQETHTSPNRQSASRMCGG